MKTRTPGVALLAALALDNFGSGLFVPYLLLYVQSSGGWDLASASRLLGVGTVVALLVPALISRLSLRLAPRTFVLTAQLTLAASSALFLLTGSTVAFVAGAVLWSCGMQAFYASVFALIAEYPVGEGGDVSFARASMARDGAFAVATALAAFILERLGSEVLTAFLVANLVSCLLAAAIIALGVPGGRATLASETGAQPATVSVLRTPGFLALILVAVALNLPVDLHLMATPVFVTGHSAAPTWVAGVSIAVLSVTTSVGATLAVRVTARLSRRANLLLATGLFLLWASLMALAGVLGALASTIAILAAVLALGAGAMVCVPRLFSATQSLAPEGQAGRFMAALQYSFTLAQVAAPLVAGALVWGAWGPWAVVAVGLLAAGAALVVRGVK